jgi:multicomponent Na+:H+ antiporter subunit D
MTTGLVVAPLLVVLLGGVLTLAVGSWPRLQRWSSVLTSLAYAGAAGVLAWAVVAEPGAGHETLVYQVGGWPAPHGITLVADALSVFMLVLTAVVAVYAVTFSVLFVDEANQQTHYHPLLQFLLLGATGAFLTGDLFNLFVWFEVMLMASYVFVAFYGNDTHTAAAMRYVVLNIVGSALMLLSIGGLYATVGTLNMAEMARLLATPEASTATTPVVGLSGLLLVTFALKAGLVPFQFWVPSAYRSAPIPVVAVFAGATKKVGLYAIVRVYFTVFGRAEMTLDVPVVPTETAPLAFLAVVLLAMGVGSILVGGVGAVAQDRLDGLFAYSSIGQVGFIAVPVGLAAATTAPALRHVGILAALVYALHHALTKGLLFLSVGAIRDGVGTTQIAELGGIGQRDPLFAGTFLVGILSLVGIPPLAGFFGKLFAFRAAADQLAFAASGGPVPSGVAAGLLVVLVVGACLTIVYATRAWIGCFWGAQSQAVAAGRFERGEIAVLATLAGLVILVGVGFDPVYEFADAAAEAALDVEAYVEAVDPGGESR